MASNVYPWPFGWYVHHHGKAHYLVLEPPSASHSVRYLKSLCGREYQATCGYRRPTVQKPFCEYCEAAARSMSNRLFNLGLCTSIMHSDGKEAGQ